MRIRVCMMSPEDALVFAENSDVYDLMEIAFVFGKNLDVCDVIGRCSIC